VGVLASLAVTQTGPQATLVNMRGRDMPGWPRVSSDDLRTDDQLARWVEIGTRYVRSLPPK
jgi:hypothetical protein